MPLDCLYADTVKDYRPSDNLARRHLSPVSGAVSSVNNSAAQPSIQAELAQLRRDIKRTSEELQRHQLHAGYEDVRQHPLSTAQKLKDLLVRVQMAGSGHQPGHVPNCAMQKKWAAEERLTQLNQRYVPLATAEALAQMSDQLMAAEQTLESLPDALAAELKPQVERFKERYEAAKFGLAISIGQDFAKDAEPLMPLFNLTTYLGLQQAGDDIRGAARAAQDLYRGEFGTRPNRLYENRSKMFAEDERQAWATNEAIALDKPPQTTQACAAVGSSWVQQFASDARELLSRIDKLLSLPSAEGADLKEVVVLLKDMVGQGRHAETVSLQALSNGVYRPTTERIASEEFTEQLQSMAVALRGWLVMTGALAAQRVGNAIEQHPVITVGALAALGVISNTYSAWNLPPSPALDEPPIPSHERDLTLLERQVEIALDTPLPGKPEETIGEALQNYLDTVHSRDRRDTSSIDEPSDKARQMLAVMNELTPSGTQTFGSLIRQAADIADSVSDQELAQAISSDLERHAALLELVYAPQLSKQMSETVSRAFKWMEQLYSPILIPAGRLDEIVSEQIKRYEKETGKPTNLKPESLIRVDYEEAQSANPNWQITASVKKSKSFPLYQVATGIHERELSLMKDALGRSFKVVGVEHEQLVDFIDKSSIKNQLESEFDAYLKRPELKENSLEFYQKRVLNAARNYLEATPVSHPGHKLMTDFLKGDAKASTVTFHGAAVNGVFAVTHGQTAVLCSVDDDAYFYIGKKINHYSNFGYREKEVIPNYPSDKKFREWIRVKLPKIEQVKLERNPAAFDVTRTKNAKNAFIGMGDHGGKVSGKPIAFESKENLESLGTGLFDASMERVRSDIDTLIFTDWEQFGLEGLRVGKALFDLYSYSGMMLAPGTGSFLSRAAAFAAPAVINAAGAGLSAIQGQVTDDPTERDAANKQAMTSLITSAVMVGAPVAIGGLGNAAQTAKAVDSFASKIGYHRFAKSTIKATLPQIVRDFIARRTGGATPYVKMPAIANKPFPRVGGAPRVAINRVPAGSSVVKGTAPVAEQAQRWSKLSDAGKVARVSAQALDSPVGRKLSEKTSEAAVTGSVVNNLEMDSAGAPRQHYEWGKAYVETFRARTKLKSDLNRLTQTSKALDQLRSHPPVIQTTRAIGNPQHAAASWVAASSQVKLPEGRLRQIIEQYQGADLSRANIVDDIHSALTSTFDIQPASNFRPSGVGPLMGSDIAHGYYQKMLAAPYAAGQSNALTRAEWLFALTRNIQPYAKNNDPLARVLYSIAQLQDTNNHVFNALTRTAEQQLTPIAIIENPPLTGSAGAAQRAPSRTSANSHQPPDSSQPVDTRVEPFRQIEANPSREIPPHMRGFMDEFRNNDALAEAFSKPSGQCAVASEIVGKFMVDQGFEKVRYRAMRIWVSRNPNEVRNHFFPIGNYKGTTYAIDLTAPQFANSGLPTLTKPMFLPEPALMKAYQTASDNAIIKYKDFSNLRSAETAFNPYGSSDPKEFIEGGHILSHGRNKVAQAATPNAATLSPSEIREHRLRHAASAHRVPARATPRDKPLQIKRELVEAQPSAPAKTLDSPAPSPPKIVTGMTAVLSTAEQSRQAVERALPIARSRLSQAIRTIADPAHREDSRQVCKIFFGSDSDATVQGFKSKQLEMQTDLDRLELKNIRFIAGEGEGGWIAQLDPSAYKKYAAGQVDTQYLEVSDDGAMEVYRDMGNSDDALANTLIHEVSHGMPADEDFVYAAKLRGAREDIADLLNLGKSTRVEDFNYPGDEVEDGSLSLFAKHPDVARGHNADSTMFGVALLDQAKNNRALYNRNIAAITAALDKAGGGVIRDTVPVKVITKREAATRQMPPFLIARNQRTGDIVAVFERMPAAQTAANRNASQHVVDLVQSVFRWQ